LLVNKLQDQALNGTELADGQQKAIEILLRKALPDLQAVQLSSDPKNPIQLSVTDGRL
jgi:hypothetical protein